MRPFQPMPTPEEMKRKTDTLKKQHSETKRRRTEADLERRLESQSYWLRRICSLLVWVSAGLALACWAAISNGIIDPTQGFVLFEKLKLAFILSLTIPLIVVIRDLHLIDVFIPDKLYEEYLALSAIIPAIPFICSAWLIWEALDSLSPSLML